MKTLSRLSKLTLPLLPVMSLAIILGTLGHLCAIGIPFLGALALTTGFPVKVLIFVGIARGVLHYVEQYCNHFIAFKLLARIRSIVFEKLRSLGPAKLDTKEKGSLVALITSDIELLEVFYAHTISPVCIAVLVCGCVIALMANFSPILAGVAFVFYVIVGIFIPLAVSRSSQKNGSRFRSDFAGLNSYLLDSLRGITMTILYGNGEKRLEAIKEKSDVLAFSRKKISSLEGLTSSLTGLFVTLGSLTVLFVSLYLMKKGVFDFVGVVLCTTLMFSSFGPVIAVANLGSGLSQTVASGKRVLEILDEKPVVEEKGFEKIENFSGAAAENVTFSYQGNEGEAGTPENILQNVTVTFEKNKITGIMGKSGSGKSTLLKLFMHFYEADSGKIKISGKDVKEIESSNLKKTESYVSQETVLFHDTIENNLRIAKLDATLSEIEEACRKANIHDFITKLKDGYQTQAGELGDNFSGGERQRLGLARAFLHGGDFLILDEPTSNLDAWNEKEIMKAVKKEAADKTVVIVSHRKSTFELADRVIQLESGRKS